MSQDDRPPPFGTLAVADTLRAQYPNLRDIGLGVAAPKPPRKHRKAKKSK